jgi:hypothetical protein
MSDEVELLLPLEDITKICTSGTLLKSKLKLIDQCINAEEISNCFNEYLSPFGITSEVIVDINKITINDDSMSRLVDILTTGDKIPEVTEEVVMAVNKTFDVARTNNIGIVWKQEGMKRSYFIAKQRAFQTFHFINAFETIDKTTVAARASATGSTSITFATTITLSFLLGNTFKLLENLIPNKWNNTKVIVKTAKLVTSLPYRGTEYVVNALTFKFEEFALGKNKTLPINITKEFMLDEGPNITEMQNLKDLAVRRIIGIFKKKLGE